MSHGFGKPTAIGPSGHSGMSGISGFSGFSGASPLYGPFSKMIVASSVSFTNNGGGETSLLGGTLVGSKIITANTFTVGKSLRWSFWGAYSNFITISGMSWRLRLGGVQLGIFSTVNSGSDGLSKHFSGNGYVTCLSTGVSGTFSGVTQGFTYLTSSSTGPTVTSSYINPIVIDTTINNTIDFSISGLSSSSQSCELLGGYIELLG